MSGAYLQKMFGLEGKTAIATGSTGGLGLDMTLALANAGCDIISIELPNDPRSHLLASVMQSLDRKLTVFHCDMLDTAAIRSTFAKIWEAGIVADILLNCAGVQRRGKVEDFKDEDLDFVFGVNLKACFVVAQEFGRRVLHEGRSGKVINIASIIAFIGNVNISPYACTKGGVLQMTKAFSNEWSGRGINVNCICPGYMKTDMTLEYMKDQKYVDYILGRTPIGRWGLPEDLAGAVLYLASPASDFVTGTSIVCDGGLLAK